MSMAALLTTRQVQEMINVDKSTIYRMADDGRLMGIKVGKQWRFPADQLAEKLGGTVAIGPAAGPHDLHRLIIPEAAQAIADMVADLLGVMAVVTDIDGRALTAVSNPCGFFAAVAGGPQGAQACIDGWRRLGFDIGAEPELATSHLGFLCARSFITIGSEQVGMVIVGGVTPDDWPPHPDEVTRMATILHTPVDVVAAHIHQTYDLDEGERRWVLRVLPQISDLISRLATARSELLGKLDQIAALAAGAAQRTGRST